MRESDKYQYEGAFYKSEKPASIANPCHERKVKEEQQCNLGEDPAEMDNFITAATAYHQREDLMGKSRTERKLKVQKYIRNAILSAVSKEIQVITVTIENDFEKYQTEIDEIVKPFQDKGYLIKARKTNATNSVTFFISFSMTYYDFNERVESLIRAIDNPLT